MSSPIEQVSACCNRAFHTGSLLLRGTPAAAGWILGWLSAEFAPQVLTGHALSVIPSPLEKIASALAVQRADAVLDSALRDTFGERYTDAVHHPLEPYSARRPNPAVALDAFGHRRRYAKKTLNIPYGPNGHSNHLDVWRRPDLPEGHRAPVLIQVPGGGWSVNDKRGQGYPLMSRMTELGWICVSINYSRSPRNAWPAHIVDVKRAIAWVRANIAEYGGDPDFIAITGGSAGGHLCSLAALSAGRDASPMFRAHRGAPPFFVLHGENDAVVPSSQAREFCTALRTSGARSVSYAELPKAHHAFDTIATLRCQLASEAVAAFLGIVYGRHVSARKRARRVAISSAS